MELYNGQSKFITVSNPSRPAQNLKIAISQIIELYNKGLFEEVVSLAEKLDHQYPNMLIIKEILGAAYLSLENNNKTIENYQKVLKINPSHTDAYNNMGRALFEQGMFDQAIESYQKAIELEPDFADAHYNLGNALKHGGDLKSAILSYQTSLSISPDDSEVLNIYGNSLKACGDLDKANECYHEALKINKHSLIDQGSEENLGFNTFRKAQGINYLTVLKKLHERKYECYFEIGSRTGSSLELSQSPSVGIDPYFQLKGNIVGKKDFCLLFQEKSDQFFEKSLNKFPEIKCELGFIDGMHLFEYALKDFINLNKISSLDPVFLFHDPMPWSYEMVTRNFESLPQNADWVGDIWKLITIFIELGMKDQVSVLTAAPSGLLAVVNPDQEAIFQLEKNFDDIVHRWKDISLEGFGIGNFYNQEVFISPENFLIYLENIEFGNQHDFGEKVWVSQ